MKETICEAVRRELEELMLGEKCGMTATHHLRECGDCREFHQQQTKLRQIVGSLGTVEAPPDFDFRLRARLANDSASAGFHLRTFQWSFANKGFAAAAMVLLFVGGAVYVRTVVNQPATSEIAEQRNEPPQPVAKPSEERVVVVEQSPPLALDNAPRRAGGERRRTSRTRPPLVAVDFGSERPPVITHSARESAIFPIDTASLQSLKVSVDDGRGNARTISVPAITFGSQRFLPVANQVAQKDVRVW